MLLSRISLLSNEQNVRILLLPSAAIHLLKSVSYFSFLLHFLFSSPFFFYFTFSILEPSVLRSPTSPSNIEPLNLLSIYLYTPFQMKYICAYSRHVKIFYPSSYSSFFSACSDLPLSLPNIHLNLKRKETKI